MTAGPCGAYAPPVVIPQPIDSLEFRAPGPGVWQINATHVPRPWPRFQTALYTEQIARGFRETGRRYGLLVDFEMPFVNGFAYFRLAPVSGAQISARFAAAEAAFAGKLWRADLGRWEREAKPAAVRAHVALQAIDPAGLDPDSLVEHLDRCRTQLARMIYQHHWFNGAATLPIGDFLAQALGWTGRPVTELLPLVRGFSPVSAGRSAELDQLLAELSGDVGARAEMAVERGAAETLGRLRRLPGAAGQAFAAYLDLVGYRLIDGHNVGESYALEQPHLLLAALRRRLDEPADRVDTAGAEQVARLRDLVPDSERVRFDELLEEARLTSALRDERGVFSDVWAAGIARRVLLEVGRRLVAAGLIEHAEHAVEADYSELRALMSGRAAVAPEELAARAAFRSAYRAADAPPRLGSDPEPAPSLDALPAAARRAMRAFGTAMGNIFELSEAQSENAVVHGFGASPGVHVGIARVMDGPADFARVEAGDVLVAPCTSEALNVLLPLVGAIVTDAGGYLSHPAIVAREFGIPAVVGSLDATRLIADGMRVRVDGARGEVMLLG